MSNVQAPKFLTDLVHDLRERKLLIPAALLLLAVVAAPVLLSRSAEPAPPPPVPAEALSTDADAVRPAVLVEETGVRDYRKRLERLKSKNPFDQQFTDLPGGSAAAAELAGGLDDAAGGTVSLGGGDADAGGLASETGTASGTTSSSGSSAPVSTPTGSGGSGGGEGSPEIQYYTHRIDVTVGPVGDTVRRDGVKQLAFLPNEDKPVAVFLGVSGDAKRAVFLVSSDVDSVSGDGSCLPDAGNCEYLVLRDGEEQTLHYQPDGQNYKLKLRAIRVVKLDEIPGTNP